MPTTEIIQKLTSFAKLHRSRFASNMGECMDEAERRIGSLRGETTEEVRRRFSKQQITQAPRFNKHLHSLMRTKFEATGVEDGLAWVCLEGGRKFYSPISHAALQRQYSYVSDLISPQITEDTLLAAIDAVQRYVTDFTWPPEEILPAGGSAKIIELGAYLGHKTVRFAEELAYSGGKVLAVEMMPDNCEILRRNVEANGFQDVIEVLPVGVWNKAGEVPIFSKGRQRNSILPIDKLEDGERLRAEVRTLDQIIDGWGQDHIDLVFVTVNGVEVHVLEGMSADRQDVHSFFVAAPYLDKDKTTNSGRCREIFTLYGYKLIDVGNPNRVVAVR